MTTPLFFLFFLLIIPVSSELHEFFFQGFKHAKPNITINGEAEIQNDGILCLTHNQNYSIGRAFYSSPVKLKNSSYGIALSFSTSFAFQVKSLHQNPTAGGDGFAFTISTSKELLGASANEYLGLLNQTSDGNPSNHIFAVEFDTFKNYELGDIDYNHVGIDINSLRSRKSVPAAYFLDGSSRTTRTELLLNSGKVIQAWVDYDSTKNLLEVRLSPFSTKPMSPILSFHVDLSPIFKDYMYVGFSSSTGYFVNSHCILGWSFNMSGEAKSFTSLPSPHHGSKSNDRKVLVGVSVSVVFFIIAAIAMYFCIIRKKMKADEMEPWELQVGPHRYSHQELKIATKGFRQQELLGVGGFGMVYKGTLPKCKTQVAVKRILHESKQGLREFLTEIESISRLRHKNLVQLLGWCRREGDLLIVYDYMPNGSLDKYLFDEPKAILSWEQRFKIIKDVGYGLLYLHEEWEETVIHRDVKAGNVLLDGELNGKLGDFGLAKLYEKGSNPITTKVVGTLGYLAPELTKTGKPTTSSDVFSFGAFLLEVVCGRKPIEQKALPEELFLVDWVWEKWKKGAVPDVVDKRLSGEFDEVEAVWVVKLGLMCSNNAPNARPSMRQAMRYLEGEAALPDAIAAPDGSEGKTISFGGDGGKLKEFLHSSLQGSSYSEESTLSFGGEREDNDIEASSVSSVSLSGGMEVTKQQRNKLP